MAITRTSFPIYGFALLEETRTTAGSTAAICLHNRLALQLTGSATAISAHLERSTRNPEDVAGPNWARIDSEPVSGNAATGITVVGYDEPAAAWYRVVIDSISGGSVVISLSGGAA